MSPRTGYTACIRHENFLEMPPPVINRTIQINNGMRLISKQLIATKEGKFNRDFLKDERAYRNHFVDPDWIEYEITIRILENLMSMSDKET